MSEIKSKEGDFFHIKDLLVLFMQHWYWFAASIVVCVLAALVYIAITPPTFTRSATMLIKNDSKNNSGTSGGAEALSEFGLLKSNTDVKTEVHVFKSPQLMEDVVRRLKLNDNYRVKFRNIRFVDLYDSTPILVRTDSLLRNAELEFSIRLLPSGEVALTDININGERSEEEVTGKLSEAIKLSQGVVTIQPTALYSDRQVGKDIYFAKNAVRDVAEACSEHLSVNVSEDDAPIIQLSYVDINPQRAEDLLNALISIYNENWIKDKNQITASTSEFINERLKVIEAELGHVDENISDFKSRNLLPDLNAVSGMYLTQSSNNTSQLTILQNQLSMARYIRSYMNDATGKNRLLPANTGIDNAGIEGQIEKYNGLLLQKNNLAANSSEQNPVVVDLNRNLVFLKDAIMSSIDDYISTLNIQLGNVRREEKLTNQKIASNPNQAKYLLNVERQQKVKEELYLFLLQKREENELAQTFTAHNTKIINPPGGDVDPTAPRKKVVLVASFVIGLLLPGVILFLKESFNTLIREKKDLEVLNLPFLGEIPNVGKKAKGKESEAQRVVAVVEDKNRNVVNEAFRNIRTNIDFMRPRGGIGTVIMVTSLTPGSGKTFTSLNTALSMAIKGARTIVLDVDLRKASLSTVVNSPSKGITNYLNGSVENWQEVVCKGEVHPHLDLMPVGKIPPNPSELLIGTRFADLIEQLKQQYDYVFLDCPPALIVTDTSIIGPVCDLTMFVVRVGLVDKRSLPEIEQIHSGGQIRNMSLILNGLDFTKGKYGYHRYGYQRYGYGNEE